MTLQELKADLLADGVIDAAEVAKLKEILYADVSIDKEEANLLFEINDAVTGKENDPSWESFFIQAISEFLLEDEVSPVAFGAGVGAIVDAVAVGGTGTEV